MIVVVSTELKNDVVFVDTLPLYVLCILLYALKILLLISLANLFVFIFVVEKNY